MSAAIDTDTSALDAEREARVLVPIRYPLTDQSTRTLDHAARLARETDAAELLVLHVNLFQAGDHTSIGEIERAVASIIDDFPAAVLVRRGFLLEEILLEEATRLDADVIVLGENQQPAWRRIFSRLLGNEPDLAAFLDDRTDARIERPA